MRVCSLFFVSLIALGCSAQSIKTELKKLYPDAKNVDWRKDKNGNQEAHFKMYGSHYRADFSPEGTWIETERNIEWGDLPPAVKHTIKKEANKDDIEELEEVHHHEKGWFYDVEIKKKKKGKRDLVIAPDGQLIDKERWKR